MALKYNKHQQMFSHIPVIAVWQYLFNGSGNLLQIAFKDKKHKRAYEIMVCRKMSKKNYKKIIFLNFFSHIF